MKLRKIAVAFVLLVALFAASVVPVVACSIRFTDARSSTRTDTRQNTNTTAFTSSVSPTSVFQSVSVVISSRHYWHDGWLNMPSPHVGQFPSMPNWQPGQLIRTQSRTMNFTGYLRSSACPIR